MLTRDGARMSVLMIILTSIGLIMLFSTSAIFAENTFHDPYYFFKKQIIYACLGLAFYMFFLFFNISYLKNKGWILYAVCAAALCAVLVPGLGHSAGGARRWIRIAGFTMQPAEFVKLAMVVFFADYFSKPDLKSGTAVKGFIVPLLLLGFICGIILLQPDFGTACAVGVFSMIVFYVAGVKMRYLGCAFLCALPAIYSLVFHAGYRRKRMLAFLNPWDDPQGIGFQIIQSFIALGSGGLFGVGLGQSKQKLYYLPEAHTDFIFAILGEELGFVGGLSILILFLAMIMTGIAIVKKIRDRFLFLLATGLVAMIGFQVVINIAVVTGSLPTKGLPLPFMSFGGSSLLMMMMAAGILTKIDELSVKTPKTGIPAQGGRVLKI